MDCAKKSTGKKKASMVPVTNRSASGSNWENLKSIAGSSIKRENEGHSAKQRDHDRQRGRHLAHLLNMAKISQITTVAAEEHRQDQKGLTKFIAMDCEMVGVGDDGSESIIARVSIVNRHGYCVYDKYVKPREQVTDYRTDVSGILPHHIAGGEDFEVVQKEVSDILKERLLVGHDLRHDLRVLYLSHPYKLMRDTSKFKPFKVLAQGRTPSLKKLAMELLGRTIQIGEHSSVEDARATMQLYILYKNKWESEFFARPGQIGHGHASQKSACKKTSQNSKSSSKNKVPEGHASSQKSACKKTSQNSKSSSKNKVPEGHASVQKPLSKKISQTAMVSAS